MNSKLNTPQKEILDRHQWFTTVGEEMGIWAQSKYQQLFLIQNDEILGSWSCSTAKAGLGEQENSLKTPRGWHEIAKKIGSEAKAGAVFSSRQLTGQIWSPQISSPKDLILSRILWIRGLEPGLNKGPGIDSYQRYIYIHGSNHLDKLGQEASLGCLRMHPEEVIDLFNRVNVGVKLLIN